MITIKEIAKTLGLSTTTVSNVIHGKTKEVSETTVEKVEAVLKAYDYVPNINARNLAQNKSKLIALVMRTRMDKYENFAMDPFVSELIGGIEKTIRKAGYFMMIYISEDIGDIMKKVSSWNTDGLLLLGMDQIAAGEIQDKYKKPMVFIDVYADPEHYYNVGLEDEEGTYSLTQYLISQGHRKITFMADNQIGVDYHRYLGFSRAIRDAGLPFAEEDLFIHNPGKPFRKESFEKLCARVGQYSAIICASDFYAVNVVNELMDRGYAVPQDISVAGFDDNLLAKLYRPAITTVHQDVEKKGEMATELLLKLLKGEKLRPRSTRLPTRLCVRESVRSLI